MTDKQAISVYLPLSGINGFERQLQLGQARFETFAPKIVFIAS